MCDQYIECSKKIINKTKSYEIIYISIIIIVDVIILLIKF